MTKEDLINSISAETGYLKVVVSNVLEEVFKHIINAVSNSERVQFTNFGTFYAKNAADRSVYDFKNKSSVKYPARIVPAFKPGKVFKESVESNGRQ